MLRTKINTAYEGGVAAGLGALDSPFLVDFQFMIWAKSIIHYFKKVFFFSCHSNIYVNRDIENKGKFPWR